jgi:superfamily II DNA or RNA helicase
MALENSLELVTPPAERRSLQAALSAAHPLYVLPKDPVTAQVLIPALQATDKLDVMMGYFASSSLADIAPGLATFLQSSRAPLRLVVSPFLTTGDFEALTQDESYLSQLARNILIDDVPGEELITRHTLECFAWLITQERLILKVAVMRHALFHPKVWLFEDEKSRAALHGSTNLTRSGLSRNREQLTLSRDWKGEEATFHIERLRREFDDLWAGGDDDCYVLPLPDAVARKVIETYKTESMPDEDTFRTMWHKAHGTLPPPTGTDEMHTAALRIPSHLVYETGAFAHQGEAIKAWESSGRRSILEMATGSGKTITSMICAAKLQHELNSLLVVVAAPYRPLIEQWCEEIREFGVQPINLSAASGPAARSREIKQAGRRLRLGNSRAEVLVVSNDTLCTEQFIDTLAAVAAPKLLIADECHNLGAASFTANPPEIFEYRLGLSATPVRQYDEEGTDALIAYFGEICFSFTLEEAIGTCLTEYDYHVHFVELTEDEMREWSELTDKIAAQAWKLQSGRSDPYLDNLLRRRRLVLETAAGKLNILADLLDVEGARALRYALVYATDKNPRQLELVNELLQSRGVLFHQLTQDETQSRQKTKNILGAFQEGVTQVLTAKRVLDEGVNIPQIKLAYILASTTVKRQWVQRRGRLLRTCKAIGKTHAVIHDFVVLPAGSSSSTVERLDRDARRLVRSELERVWEFARLSRNGALKGGPYEAVEHLQELANERVID